MALHTPGARLFCAVLAMQWSLAVMGAELPTADEILQTHWRNKQHLSTLHLQGVHRYETTEAACRQAQKAADQKEMLFDAIAKSRNGGAPVLINGRPAGQALLAELGGASARTEIQRLRDQVRPFQVNTVMEFFLNGEDYQFRYSNKSHPTDEELKSWKFPETQLTTESLMSDYREIGIYSRSAKSKPAARWWHQSAGRHAYIMNKHLGEVMNRRLPPFTEITHPGWGSWHPYDAFFSQPADKYRVVRQDEVNGRVLTVVEVAVPIHPDSSTRLAYRGWLDLNRGAVPIRMFYRQNSGVAPVDQFDLWQPDEIITTHEVREIQAGVFYPAKIVNEHFDRDPDAPEFTKQQWAEVRAGTRKIPMVVSHRHTWDCSLVEIKTGFVDGFFEIPFPDDQQLFDHDAGKMIGALEEKPLVKVGQKAPQLSIAHWLDGKQRTLEDLKGQVVVLDFWGLWCGPCRSSVPHLKELQDHFTGKPVTFISIHTAEANTDALAAKIQEFQKANDWHFIGAIDQGQRIENSVTVNAYGCLGFPLMVIIDPSGKIAYVDPQDVGMACDEENPKVVAEFEKKFNEILKRRFESVGEPWPLPKNLDEKQQREIHDRVGRAYIIRQIELALGARAK